MKAAAIIAALVLAVLFGCMLTGLIDSPFRPHMTLTHDATGEQWEIGYVAETGSMEPTLNGNSILYQQPIISTDVRSGMMLVAEVDGEYYVKRLVKRGSVWYLTGDNFATTATFIYRPEMLSGFVERYTTNGRLWVWDGGGYTEDTL